MARIKGIRLGLKRKRNTKINVGEYPKPKNKNSTISPHSISSDSVEIVSPAGFIFLCNNKTKPRCFQYQVFGLSMSQKKTVEKIKPGTKLFLFDYTMRLLHGVYEAVSHGKLDLEPHAFQGKYLAQVKFRIVRDCLPLQEKYFKSAILENYRSGRLRLELSEQQVHKLVPLFHPFTVTASSSSEPPVGELKMTSLSRATSPYSSLSCRRELINDQYDHNYKNFSRLQYSLQILQHQHQPTAGNYSIMNHHAIHNVRNPIHDDDHLQDSHYDQMYPTRGHKQIMQEPYHPRHVRGQEYWIPQNQLTMGLSNDYHQPPSIMRQPIRNSPHPPQETDHQPTWYHHHQQLPFLRENPITTSTTGAAAFSSSVLATNNPKYSSSSTMQQPPPYDQLPYLVTGQILQPLINPPTFGVTVPTTNYDVSPTTPMHSSSSSSSTAL